MGNVEFEGGAVFLRIGRVEVYGRRERPARWAWEREPGSVEVMAGLFRLTVSKAPGERERAASRGAMRDLMGG